MYSYVIGEEMGTITVLIINKQGLANFHKTFRDINKWNRHYEMLYNCQYFHCILFVYQCKLIHYVDLFPKCIVILLVMLYLN